MNKYKYRILFKEGKYYPQRRCWFVWDYFYHEFDSEKEARDFLDRVVKKQEMTARVIKY